MIIIINNSVIKIFNRQWSKWESINPIFLTFSHLNWEIPFLREPDPLFKFFVGCAVIVLLFMGFMLLVPAINFSEYVYYLVINFISSIF